MVLSIFDALLTPIYFLIFLIIANGYQKRKQIVNPAYKFYTRGLVVKMCGAISICLIYQLYYTGGDTVNYFLTAKAILNMADKDFGVFIGMMSDNSVEAFSNFDDTTGYPIYWRDENAIFVARLIVPILFLGCKAYIPTAILLAVFTYSGIWKMYMLFESKFPQIRRNLAIAFLFIPSVVFWGSGLLKDTITLSAVGWYTYEFYYFFIEKKYSVRRAINILLAGYLLIAIKPYILFALLPGSIIWFTNEKAASIRSKIARKIAMPILISIGIGLGIFVLSQMGDYLGLYALDNVLDRALVVNLDQKQDYYGGNSFDIGDFEPTITGVLSKAHLAISYALFGPFLWQTKNVVMLLSAIENTYILMLTVFLLIRLRFFGFFRMIGKNPLLLFSILFSLFFAFSVGLATSNFGSLVRLKIPCIPFYVASLFVMQYYEKKKGASMINRKPFLKHKHNPNAVV